MIIRDDYMRILLVAIIGVLILMFTAACSTYSISRESNDNNMKKDDSKSKGGSYINIKPEEAKKLLESRKDIVLLDVRTLEEYTEKHIPGSILIPVDEITEKASDVLKDKEAKIFVYCRSGRRSVTASEKLIQMGYANVYNLGGIIDWKYETETGAPVK